MDEEMRKLLKAAEKVEMSPEEKEAQRRSFAYGNAHLSNPNVTREMVDEEAEKLEDVILVSGARSGMSAKFAEEVFRATWERELRRIEEERKQAAKKGKE